MTPPSPPTEPLQIRGETLTPESPRPLHIPEPSNIPLLQSQMDPSFNDQPPYTSGLEYSFNAISNKDGQDLSFTHTENGLAKNNDGICGRGADAGGINVEDDHLGGDGSSNNVRNQILSNVTGDSSSPIHPNPSSIDSSIPSPLPNFSSQNLLPQENLHSASDDLQQHNSHYIPSPGSKKSTDLRLRNHSNVQAPGQTVDYQALLENLSQSTATRASVGGLISATTISPTENPDVSPPNSTRSPTGHIVPVAGLPPRPPPQEKPAIHPNYSPNDDIRSFHYPSAQAQNTHSTYSSESSNAYRPPAGFSSSLTSNIPGLHPGANGLPPPPLAKFQQAQPPSSQPSQLSSAQMPSGGNINIKSDGGDVDEHGRAAAGWDGETERAYTQFLRDEKEYISEGSWDRFPIGSRVFIGNLSKERINKRDLFPIFYKHGRLAQLSIKNAYAFAQYFDAESASKAIRDDQGIWLKGKKLHLEISRPQKVTRSAAAGGSRAGSSKRSRSPPDYGRNVRLQRSGGDRYDRSYEPTPPRYSDYRDEPNRRDSYTSGRPPSPRGYRERDVYRSGRERSLERYGKYRPRTPSPLRGDRGRSRSPRGRDFDEDTALPIPRRRPEDIPDVQIILFNELDKNFVRFVERAFRDKGLACGVLLLSPRIPLPAVIRRQQLEGVHSVIKLSLRSQQTGKVSLHLFKRNGSDVRFEDYDDIEAARAAELTLQIKRSPPIPPSQYSQLPTYSVPSYSQMPYQHQQPPPPVASAYPANTPHQGATNPAASVDPQTIQKILGALQQVPQTMSTQQSPATQNPANLASLLSSVPVQPSNLPGYTAPMPRQSQYPGPAAVNPALSSILGGGGAGVQQQQPYGIPQPPPQQYWPPQSQTGQPQAPDMRNLMQTLERFKRQ